MTASSPRRWLAPATVLVATFAGWQLVTTLGHVAPTVLPGPRLIAASTWDDRANLWPAVTTTTEEVALGLALALVVGVVAAVAVDGSRVVRGGVYPLIVASQTLPIIALAPLVVIWFGFGLTPKVVLVALFSFFPITVGMVSGLASADPDAVALLRTLRASRLQLLLRVRLPGALPQLFTGLRISATYAYTSAIVAEFVGAQQGIGVYMTNAKNAPIIGTDLVFGATLVTAVLTVALFVVVGLVQRLAMPLAAAGSDVTAPGRSLEVRGLSRRFPADGGEVHAVHRFDLTARPGEFVSLIGPSGCGKSTVFNIVAGLDRPDLGEIRIDGEVLADRLGASAYMPQRDALLAWRRVIDNVALPVQLQGQGKGAARDAARPLLERFGLGEFTQAWPWQLSGGMRQRAAFLRTVVTRPALMLLDEPFGALDGITRADLQQWLAGVWAEFGATVLLVTHDVAEAVFLSDRIYVMTPRPGTVAAEITVGLPHPRRAEDRETEAFVAVERRLRHELRASLWPATG